MTNDNIIIECGFCGFASTDGKLVSDHWKCCRERIKLEVGMILECE